MCSILRCDAVRCVYPFPQVRQLRDENWALKKAKTVAEVKENEVRRELSDVRQQLDGMDLDNYKKWQHDNEELKKQVGVSLTRAVSAITGS